MTVAIHERRLQVGVEVQRHGGVHARVWAPARREVELVKDGETQGIRLDAEANGFFSGAAGLAPGDGYWFRLDGDLLRPDPASRFQPEGPHGPSQVVDPDAFRWTDPDWDGVERDGQVLYEMHVGTFTPEGTWAAAAAELEELARLGITVIEMMPVNDFAGQFGWGYDGVNLYAPTRLYGTPDDLRRFVDRAHALGLGVILDVVYNHLGPDGNYLADFSPHYFTTRYANDWGQAINFEGPAPAREYFVDNAGYWIDEFHIDGLRVDATQDMHDASPEHVLAAIARRARQVGTPRRIFLVGENEPQDTRLVRPPADGGYGLDALWNDDYHHTAVVALTGRREAYYLDYTGSPQELISCAKYGFLYQGQWYSWQKQRRGTAALDLPHAACVTFLENHDQVANSAFGRRLHQSASPSRYRALTAVTLLGPGTPMLFQGQEFASSKPFLYFADHRPELREPIRKGRAAFLAQFSSLQDPEVRESLPQPCDEDTFRRCTLDRAERTAHAEAYALHRDLLALRHADATLTRPGRVDGALVAAEAFVIRFFGPAGDRLLLVNLGRDLDLRPAPEPLLAPPAGQRWRLAWSSESVQYGGSGTPAIRADAEWHIPGESALLLRPYPNGDTEPANGGTEDADA
jgi:maltooligosyltrehalose trehalohydrolase